MELDQIQRLLAAHQKVGSGTTARDIRQAAGYTQERVAEMVGVTQAAMSRLEAGTRKPRPETLLRWAEALVEMERVARRVAKHIAA
jgi:transcriptional regulator with XRE-family HTH domain